MSDGLYFIVPLLGAILPIVVTQVSNDQQLKFIGRSVIKYAIMLPALMVTTLLSVLSLFMLGT